MALCSPLRRRGARAPGLALVAALLTCSACSKQALTPAAVNSNTKLDKVIVYRNGVAYYERHAQPSDTEVILRVPRERLDDMLKSLTVIDSATKTALPVGFPTMTSAAREVEMRITLPAKHGPLRISYMSESPAWKASYRIMLAADGAVRLHGWAIVDNVSSEDWSEVQVGVGSSAALSFRHDLQSLRLVERTSLSSGARLTMAPPTGGSPYAVAGGQVRLLGSLDAGELAYLSTDGVKRAPAAPTATAAAASNESPASHIDQVAAVTSRVRSRLEAARRAKDVVAALCQDDKLSQLDVALGLAKRHLVTLAKAERNQDRELVTHEQTIMKVLVGKVRQLGAESRQCIGKELAMVGESSVTMSVGQLPLPQVEDDWYSPGAVPRPKIGPAPARPAPRPKSAPASPSPSPRRFEALLARLKRSPNRLRIEGFAINGDDDPGAASRARAERVRERLIAGGIDANAIDAVGTGAVRDSSRAVRIVETEQSRSKVGAARSAEPADAHSALLLGDALFLGKQPISVKHGHSVMLSTLNAPIRAERVYLYDPVSPRGSRKLCFNALRIVNPSRHTLDRGPVTVYAGARFLGEGLTEPILPGAAAFVPYALDRQLIVDGKFHTTERLDRLLTIQRGLVKAEARQLRVTTLLLSNRGEQDARVFVRHAVAPGYRLDTKPHSGVEKLSGAYLIPLLVKAGSSQQLRLEEWTPLLKSLDLRTARASATIAAFLSSGAATSPVRQALRTVQKAHAKSANLADRIDTTGKQMAVYRRRVNELNTQLSSLAEVAQAARLRRHLADKMRQISDNLSRSALSLVELKSEQLSARIELQDRIAKLSFSATNPQSTSSATGAAAAAPE